MHRQADSFSLIRYRACDCLADPPGAIRREFVSQLVLIFFNRLNETDIPFLQQIFKRQPLPGIPFGNTDDQPQIRVDHFLFCGFISRFLSGPQGQFFFFGQQGNPSDFAQIIPDRVILLSSHVGFELVLCLQEFFLFPSGRLFRPFVSLCIPLFEFFFLTGGSFQFFNLLLRHDNNRLRIIRFCMYCPAFQAGLLINSSPSFHYDWSI